MSYLWMTWHHIIDWSLAGGEGPDDAKLKEMVRKLGLPLLYKVGTGKISPATCVVVVDRLIQAGGAVGRGFVLSTATVYFLCPHQHL